MPRFQISIVMDNDAFQDDAAAKVARILENVAQSVRQFEGAAMNTFASAAFAVLDVNGNRVGKAFTSQK